MLLGWMKAAGLCRYAAPPRPADPPAHASPPLAPQREWEPSTDKPRMFNARSKALVGREQLRQAHAGDRLLGLSERQIAELHVHFVACESAACQRLCFSACAARFDYHFCVPSSRKMRNNMYAWVQPAAARQRRGCQPACRPRTLPAPPLARRHAAAGAQHGHGCGAAAAPAGGGHSGCLLLEVLPAPRLLRRRPPPPRPRLPLPGVQDGWARLACLGLLLA